MKNKSTNSTVFPLRRKGQRMAKSLLNGVQTLQASGDLHQHGVGLIGHGVVISTSLGFKPMDTVKSRLEHIEVTLLSGVKLMAYRWWSKDSTYNVCQDFKYLLVEPKVTKYWGR